MTVNVFVGFDARETDGYLVTTHSIRKRTKNAAIAGIKLSRMRRRGLYMRPTSKRDGRLFDEISKAPMATEFAISRFLTPILAKRAGMTGWVIFMDCDMLVRADLNELIQSCDHGYAVHCVKHQMPLGNLVKMDNQLQTYYSRKNWSSVMVFNLDHLANNRLNVEKINTLPGRDLHALCWLRDEEIGDLPKEWNHLVGVKNNNPNAKIVHYTLGLPRMPGYEDCEYAAEWEAMLEDSLYDHFNA